jgi:hypothetical protein
MMSNDGRNGGNKGEEGGAGHSGLAESFGASARPILTVDVEKYESWLAGSGLNEEQKEEFLRAMWSVVVTFVELGFNVHPLQEVCGQDSGNCAPQPKESFDQVRSNKSEETQEEKDSVLSDGPEWE